MDLKQKTAQLFLLVEWCYFLWCLIKLFTLLFTVMDFWCDRGHFSPCLLLHYLMVDHCHQIFLHPVYLCQWWTDNMRTKGHLSTQHGCLHRCLAADRHRTWIDILHVMTIGRRRHFTRQYHHQVHRRRSVDQMWHQRLAIEAPWNHHLYWWTEARLTSLGHDQSLAFLRLMLEVCISRINSAALLRVCHNKNIRCKPSCIFVSWNCTVSISSIIISVFAWFC